MGRLKRPPERCGNGNAFTLVVGLLLLLGVLAMHGFQASSSPADMTGVPTTSMSTAQHMSAAQQAPGESVDHHRSAGGNQPADHHQEHPGGQVCLAMLTMIALLVAATVLLCRRESAAAVARLLARIRVLFVRRPPPRPSLHRLSVLRL